MLTLAQALEKALEFHQQGKLTEAEQLYQAVLNVDGNDFNVLHLFGVLRIQQGRQDEAIGLIGAALGRMPGHAGAHNNLAAALNDLKRHAEAAESCRNALSINPDFAEAHNNLGLALNGLGRREQAIASYRSALALKPQFVEAHNNLGNALNELKRHEEAIASYRSALAARPGYAEAYYNLGGALATLDRHEEAIASYRQALALNPSYAEAHNNLGGALDELKRHEEAVASYQKALALRPDYAHAHYNLGGALAALGRHEEAIASYRKALAIKPDYAEAHNNLGAALTRVGRFEEAITSCERALALSPGYAEAHNNHGAALSELDRHEQALASCEEALALKPDFAEAHYNLGNALLGLGRCKEAIASYGNALALRPDHADTHWNLSLALLSTGDFARGWREYEWRWRAKSFASRPKFACPQWSGKEDLSGKRVLLHCEEGLGDTLQFVRYAPLVAARGARVVLSVQPPLKALLTGIAGVDSVITQGDPAPAFDFHCPLLSLPVAFGTILEDIPAEVPYLRAADDRTEKWRRILGTRTPPLVGLVWLARSGHRHGRSRSVALTRLLGLLSVPGVRFVGLQKDLLEGDAGILRAHPEILHLGDKLDDFADTAAVVSLLDLVISVDTSVAHLTGALAKPVWILLQFAAEWRWMLARDDTPWYPTARLFRQPSTGDWEGVVERTRTELRRLR